MDGLHEICMKSVASVHCPIQRTGENRARLGDFDPRGFNFSDFEGRAGPRFAELFKARIQ